MTHRRIFFLITTLILLTLLLPLVTTAQDSPTADQDSAETVLEQTLAAAAEQEINTSLLPISIASSLGVPYPLFVGVDDVAVPAYLIDPLTNNTLEAFTGAQVWGAAFDIVNNLIYFNNGTILYEWPVGGAINQLGPIVDSMGNPQSIVGLAFYNGQLYGTKNIATEAIWAIDPTTLVATIHITYPTTHDMGGFAVDPNTGDFYATDDGNLDSLVRINPDGTVTAIAPYPVGQTDIDGLAISHDGYAYLVTDEPGFIYVYDLAAGAYTTPLNNPWTTAETFSAGTWVWERPPAMCSTDLITIPSSGAASPYPATVNVEGYNSTISDVNVHLLGLSHTWSDDIDMMLVGPQGQNLIIMSDAGGSADMVNVNLTFDDEASGPLPDSSQITSGSYQPTNYEAGDAFPAPAPVPSAATTLAAFEGTDPNGSWHLYLVDDTGGDVGQLANGWCLEIIEQPPAIVVDPEELSQTQLPDIQVTQSVTISNTGAGSLEWVVGEAAASPKSLLPPLVGEGTAAASGSAAAELTAYAVTGASSPQAAVNPAAALTGPGGGGVIYYGDRVAFDAVFPGLPVEDFEAGLWGDGAILTCPAPFNNLTNNACFAPGGILSGISFQDNPLNDSGGGSPSGLAGVGAGAFGALSRNIVTNTFVDSFEIVFDPPVNAVGMDLVHYTTNGAVVNITLYDASDNQIGATVAVADNVGNFWGVYSATPIGRLNILSTLSAGNGAEGVDNVAFGQIGVCSTPLDLPWVTVNPITGTLAGGTAVNLDVTFDSTGLATGVYTGTLCIHSNDPLRPFVELPLTLTVITYGVALSGDQAAVGDVGTTISYTIQVTNTGSVADTYTLAATGQMWATTLDSSVTVAAGATASLVVEVAIPGSAGDGESDMVTITATSQGDPGESDGLLLTTTAVIPQHFIYLPFVIKE